MQKFETRKHIDYEREFAKLNEKDEHMMMLADGYLCTYILNDAPEGTSTVLQNLLIPDNVKTIGMHAFKDYYGVTPSHYFEKIIGVTDGINKTID